MEEDRCLIIFIKNPTLGNVKTRLAKELGDGPALAIYLKLVTLTLEVCNTLNMHRVVYYSDFVDTEDKWDNQAYSKEIQLGRNLGEKMMNAFNQQINKGFKNVCIIGSDTPGISSDIINMAFENLHHTDLVIGPAEDGGYYLLGMHQLILDLFENKDWGTNSVFKSTLEDVQRLDLKHFELPALIDIDTKDDLLKIWPEFKWK